MISLTTNKTVSPNHTDKLAIVSRQRLKNCFRDGGELSFVVSSSVVTFTFLTPNTSLAGISPNNNVSLQCKMIATMSRTNNIHQVENRHQTCSHDNVVEVAGRSQTYLWSGCESIRHANYMVFSKTKQWNVMVTIRDVHSVFNASVAFRQIFGPTTRILETRYLSQTKGYLSVSLFTYLLIQL